MMDIILRGGLAGIAGYSACTAANLALYWLHLVPSTEIHYNAILLHPAGTPLTTSTWISGFIVGYILAALLGLVAAYIMDRTGYDYAWLKGLLVGIGFWPVHVTIFPNLLAPRLFSELPPIMVLACFFFAVIFGVVTGLTVKYLGTYKKARVS